MNWIEAKKGNEEPKEGEIVIVWITDIEEPAACRATFDKDGWVIYDELVSVDRWDDSREGRISHWLRLPPLPKK